MHNAMSEQRHELRAKLQRWTLLLGVLQITVGCLVGFTPPTAVAWFRGIVMAHIEFTANGILVVVFGLLVQHLALNRTALWAWFVLLQVGTWTNGAAGVAAGLLGSSSKLMPTITEAFPPPNGTNDPLVSASLQVCGVTIMLALILTLIGLWRSTSLRDSTTAARN